MNPPPVIARPAGDPRTYRGAHTDRDTAAGLTVQLTGGDLGVFVDAHVSGVGNGQDCQLVLVDRNGQPHTVDSWQVDGSDSAAFRYTFTGLQLDGIAMVEVDTPDRGTLSRYTADAAIPSTALRRLLDGGLSAVTEPYRPLRVGGGQPSFAHAGPRR